MMADIIIKKMAMMMGRYLEQGVTRLLTLELDIGQYTHHTQPRLGLYQLKGDLRPPSSKLLLSSCHCHCLYLHNLVDIKSLIV